MRVIYLNRDGAQTGAPAPFPDVALEAEIRGMSELPALWA
jgi:hypothetical protein